MNFRFLHRLSSLFRRENLDADLQAEIASHIDLASQENLKAGMSPQEARRAALIKFGGREQAMESARDQRGLPFLETFFQDTRFASRIFRKSPAFTAIAVLTLALGIGATTAIFSVVYGVLLRPLPYKDPDQLVRLWEQNAQGGRANAADPNFEDLRDQTRSLSGLAEFDNGLSTVTGNGDPTRTPSASVSRDFFSVMGVQPVIGRAFVSEEQQLNAPLAVIISNSYWRQTLGSPADLSSIHLKINGQFASVVGVLPPGFRFPDNANIWLPREVMERFPSRSAHNWNLIGRIHTGFTLAQSRADLTSIAQKLKQQYGQDMDMVAVAIEPLREAMTADVRPVFFILLAASAFLLLIACANVVNLMLAQATARERELSVRAALGAQHTRLVRQFLTESFLLSVLGGALGVVFAWWGLNGLLALAPENLPRLEDVSLNGYVLLFSLAVVFLISIAMGFFTALRSVSKDAQGALAEGTKSSASAYSKQRVGRMLAATQLATALVLLVGATLLGRSLLRVLAQNSGFRTEQVLSMQIAFPEDVKSAARVTLLDNLFAKLRGIPGVTKVGGTSDLPLENSFISDGTYILMNPEQFSPEMRQYVEHTTPDDLDRNPALIAQGTRLFTELFHDKLHTGDADFVIGSSGFFPALDIPLIKGRLFDDRDSPDSPQVAIVSQSLADEKWPNENPLGHTIEFGNMDGDPRLLTVIGVVGDIRDRKLEVKPSPTIYVDYRQRPHAAWQFSVVMRSSGNPEATFAAARNALHEINPDIPPRFRALTQIYSSSLDARHFSLTLVGIFSFTALLLALAGIYGVFSYFVAQRTKEIGIRMALGATQREVLSLILKQGMKTGAIGIAAGLVASLLLTRLMQSQLFEVSPTDPLTLVSVSAVFVVVSIAATLLPAQRATRINPTVALRCE
jgi:putative ABC transport system permease protein